MAEHPGLYWLSESPSLSDILCPAVNVVDLSRAVTVKFKWKFDLEIGIFTTDFISFSNYMNRSRFKSNGDSRSKVLEVGTCRSPVWC